MSGFGMLMGAATGVQALPVDAWAWAEALNPIPPVRITAARIGPVRVVVMRRAKMLLIWDLLG
jgi:hypothetical protein